MTDIEIAELWVYPVKSLGGVRVGRAEITAAGSLRLDREWVVINTRGEKVWQGDIPRMTLLRVSLDESSLVIQAPEGEPLVLARDHGGEPASFTMYGETFSGIDAGPAASAWLSAALGAELRLVRIGDGAHGWRGHNPVHVVSRASLAALNRALAEQGDGAVVHRNFRPNLVLAGDDAPAWFEEREPLIDFGAARIRLREPCVRCELPNISLIDASRGRQPLKLIGRLSRERPTAAPASFGIYAAAEGTALSEGMRARLA